MGNTLNYMLLYMISLLFSFSCGSTQKMEESDGLPIMSDSDYALEAKMGEPYYSGTIIPTPKTVTYDESSYLLLDGPKGSVHFTLDVLYNGPAKALLLRMFNYQLDAYKRVSPNQFKSDEKNLQTKIIFTTGDDPKFAPLISKYKLKNRIDQLKPQGYLILMQDEYIICVGKDDQGIINSLASIIHLMHIRDKKLVIRKANVTDWPTFLHRESTVYHIPETPLFYDWLMLYKINSFSKMRSWVHWKELGKKDVEELRFVGEFAKFNTLSYVPMIHIGGKLYDVVRDESYRVVDAGNQEHIDLLCQTIGEYIRLTGANIVQLASDDVPGYEVWDRMPESKKKFNSLGEATAHLLEEVNDYMQEIKPGSKLMFVPIFYQGRKYRFWNKSDKYHEPVMEYMSWLKSMNNDIIIIWTGPNTASYKIVQEDIDHYKNLIGKDRGLFYWDNNGEFTYPLSFFTANYPPDFASQCAEKGVVIKINVTKADGKFFIITASDYYWNPEGFSSDRARKTATLSFLGKEALPVVEEFSAYRKSFPLRADFEEKADLNRLTNLCEKLDKVSLNPTIADEVMKHLDRLKTKRVSK